MPRTSHVRARDPRHQTKQIQIIHLSDVHFGKDHRFDPPPTPGGDRPKRVGYPTLLEKLQEDLPPESFGCPTIVCITGDFCTTAAKSEFDDAEALVAGIASTTIFGGPCGLDHIFLVPGNHDVVFGGSDYGTRWQPWTEFTNRMFGTSVRRENPWDLVQLHDRIDDLGVVILCLNSAIYVEKDKPDQNRGRLDERQLSYIENSLKGISVKRLRSAIRVAMVHHHPVLIPALAEAARGYDAVHNSGQLLAILRRYGFHTILHGHKHNPFTFTDDTQSAFDSSAHPPLLIVAGGSVGSTELPDAVARRNCYNRITVKWNADANEARIIVNTRGLSMFNRDGTTKLPPKWTWQTIRYDDRQLFTAQRLPESGRRSQIPFDPKSMAIWESKRQKEYARSRGNLPVVEVMPSMTPGQGYDAKVWIVPHARKHADIPIRVTWSCGKRFEVVPIGREEDENFCAVFGYWGPMLVQALLEFDDGKKECLHVYARLPIDYTTRKRGRE
jgi:3',5'-cyclic AMP phosphodiesterase CpdA